MQEVDKTARFYNRIAKFYPIINFGLRPYKKALKQELNKIPTGKLLDVGTGHGAIFSLSLNHEIIGIDSSSKMLSIAKRKYPDALLHLMNGESIGFEAASFDYIVLAHVISTVNDINGVMKEVSRVLKPEGKVFILNHCSPPGVFGWPSKAFGVLSKLFAFKSTTSLSDLSNLKYLKINQIKAADKLGLYKLIVLEEK